MTRIRSIDGLRGIAILLVLVQHGTPAIFEHWPMPYSPGYTGVRLFFVLSGALITFVLCRAQLRAIQDNQAPWIVLCQFYLRRSLRIFPLAYVAMAVMWWAGAPAMDRAVWYLTYSANFRALYEGEMPTLGLAHFWTLNVEEQVYLFWPIVLLFTPLRSWPTQFAWFAGAAIAGRALWLLITPSPSIGMAFAHLDSFAAGGVIGWSAAMGRTVSPLVMTFSSVGLVTVTASLFGTSPVFVSAQELGLALLTASVVAWTWTRPRQRFLSLSPLVWTGVISYGLYVWHLCLHYLVTSSGLMVDQPSGIRRTVLMFALAYGGAITTWYGFERPINRLKERWSASTEASNQPLTAKIRTKLA